MKNNKLIAEFMGVDQVDIDTWLETNSNLHYHNSWDWLMPVVKKCFEVDEQTNDDLNFKLNDALLETNTDSLYKAVVEFINEYNK
jgi:hypothetical protein